MLQGKLEKDCISQPELWRMAIMPANDGMHVALYPPVAREEIIFRSFPYDPAAPSQLKAIEDIIYENPLLLSEFKQIDCITHSDYRMILPESMAAELNEKLLDATYPAMPDKYELMEFKAAADVKCIQALESDLAAFLRRTFFNIRFFSETQLLIKYFSHHGNTRPSRRVTAIVRGKNITLIIFDGPELKLANTFTCNTMSDAAYYVMAALTNIGYTASGLEYELAIHGQPINGQDTLSEILKNYIANISSVPFPTLRYRASKTTINAPLPLLILPICES